MTLEKEKFNTLVSFIKKSFEDVTEELLETKYSICNASEEKDNAKVCIVIGITGKNKGRILLQSDFESASNFAMAMNGNDFFEDPKDMYLFLAEFSNMFCGRAATHINNEFKEREAWLTPPAIFSAKKLEITAPSVQSEKIHYKGEQGCFLIDIGFEGGK